MILFKKYLRKFKYFLIISFQEEAEFILRCKFLNDMHQAGALYQN